MAAAIKEKTEVVENALKVVQEAIKSAAEQHEGLLKKLAEITTENEALKKEVCC